jgi:hypothetical protein
VDVIPDIFEMTVNVTAHLTTAVLASDGVAQLTGTADSLSQN